MKSFTLSDGTFLPRGAMLAAPTMMFGLDPELTEDPEVFDGFRSYKKNLASEDAGRFEKTQFVTTSPLYLSFGYGRHACPGRFFAAEQIKSLLCQVILQYDIMYDEGNPRLPYKAVGETYSPDQAQRLAFKKIQGPKKFDFL